MPMHHEGNACPKPVKKAKVKLKKKVKKVKKKKLKSIKILENKAKEVFHRFIRNRDLVAL